MIPRDPHAQNGVIEAAYSKAPQSCRPPRMPDARDPLGRVLALGRKSVRTALGVAFGLALLFHGGAAAGAGAAALLVDVLHWNQNLRAAIADRLNQQYEIEEVKPPEEPKPEPKEDPPPKAEEAKTNEPPPEEPKPPPMAAQASAVLTSDPDPNEPVDLTGGFVTGSGTSFAGGVTQANGKSAVAVQNRAARADGVPGGTGTAPVVAAAPPGPDRSRTAGLSGSTDWADCPFPPEADAEQIDQAFVMLQVTVKPDGKPAAVAVVADPGHGFGREARACAMRKTYNMALDHDGNPIQASTRPFRVRFER